MITVGKHSIVYALAEAQLVAFEIAAACAGQVAPFGAKGEAEIAGNVVYITRTHADLEHVEQRLSPWIKDRARFKHRFELGMPDDLAGMVDQYKPVLVVRDLTQWNTPYQTGTADERLLWLQSAKELAGDHNTAVLTAISVEPRYAMIGMGPTAPPRHRKIAQPWNLAQFADALVEFNDETFILSGVGKSIALTRDPSRWDKRYFHLALRPAAERYLLDPDPAPEPRIRTRYDLKGNTIIEEIEK